MGLWRYMKAAFNARPIGMFVPPNWIGLAGIGLAGAALGPAMLPGVLLVGAGLELAYLFGLSTSKRFQRYVDGSAKLEERQQWQKKLQEIVAQLDPEDRERYLNLQRRCYTIIEQQRQNGDTPEIQTQREGLGKLLWIYLRLLRTRQSILRIMRESIDLDRGRGEPLDKRLKRLEAEVQKTTLSEDLRRSLEGQLEILQQRMEKRRETREKLAFLDAELVRIEEQVELLREQAVMASTPHAVSERIDHIAATLGHTQQWMRDQQRILGSVDEVLNDPPPMVVAPQRVAQ
ncbi:MAG TPA: hypothetical protein VGR35_10870 [Tepidisphaeraceae bacterium]|nr:hypothetical protein [Tepidisphaeraceae bacterium]